LFRELDGCPSGGCRQRGTLRFPFGYRLVRCSWLFRFRTLVGARRLGRGLAVGLARVRAFGGVFRGLLTLRLRWRCRLSVLGGRPLSRQTQSKSRVTSVTEFCHDMIVKLSGILRVVQRESKWKRSFVVRRNALSVSCPHRSTSR